jgi:DNA repair exonuclease SbcCD ATPase subunit
MVSINAQKVMEEEKVMSKGLQTSVSLEIKDVEENFVEKTWREYMKEFAKKTKYNRKESEWASVNSSITSINGSAPVSVFAKIDQAGKKVIVNSWFEVNGSFLNSESNSDAFESSEDFIKNFHHLLMIRKVEMELSAEEKALGKLENGLKKLQNENKKYHKEIERAKETIRKNEENIVKNIQEQKEAEREINAQLSQIEDVRVKLDKTKRNNPK